ncbi:YtfJ family protein [Aliivibrio kagoshimensis]|uniref:YtfJ family protein n=1 Tax=Aliivibrio kagoshimensis TaxID=2910230 RepID=UPI003D0E321D
MTIKTLCILLLSILPVTTWASNLTIGENVPPVEVQSHGELIIQDSEIIYQEWQSSMMLGKVRVIQAIAGRSSAKKMNAPLMTAITAKKFPITDYQTTTIINQDDAIWGTGGFVLSKAEDSKLEFSWSSLIVDEDGVVAQSWQLESDSSAIIVQDKNGNILFFKQGSLNDDEIAKVLTLIEQAI